jgi:hypothetical protein
MITTNALPAASRKGRLITLWILSGLVALAFIAAGGSKLAGAAAMIEVFDKVGLGQWFRYFTGLLEVAAGIGLLISRYASYLCGRLACCCHGWRVHRACNRARQFPRRPGRAVRPRRNHRLFTKALNINQ